MAANARGRDQRAERERARTYQARRQFHDGVIRRRRRDNLIAGVAGGVLILAVVGAQIAYYTLGPGAPEPTPSSTSTPTPLPTETTAP
ncbi:dioxygenase [Microbacterium sp. 18062]|uniref:dioxygenase n=1 Tax=Microbacterium sp. 18062 TaxID=2681410 RepID=UPI00135BECEF|nr:dioxygenase [Microbacterium sp. 18062]